MSEKDKIKDDYFREEKSSMLRSIGGLITFSTILPLNSYTSIEEMAKMTWFWPLIGAFIGVIGLIISYFLLEILFLPSLVVAAISYSFFLIINGFHHMDGLIDFGDAIMVHGSPEEKITVMRDSMIGTGGIAIFFIVAIITVSTLNSILAIGIISPIIICEMSAKIGLLSSCISSKPGPDGTGKYFIKSMTISKFIIALILAIAISYLLASFIGVFGVLGGVFGGAFMSYISEKNFKIATGDVLGASNEVGRMFSLLTMIIALIWI
ncbi:MAG: adenosylcobinamide-GDP ribazoletransferase [Methanobacteriaceae archaeon]|jgi:adenosylcobinamide-GDP ribazoletransferase|nr:adenosylcobinamide-GDP ribazoletransferase [Candidatus Methanorudis spinitermitis]